MTIWPVLGPRQKTGSTKRIMLRLVRRLHLRLCHWLDQFIPSFFTSWGSWLTNRRAITKRSSVQRRKLAARLPFTYSRARTFSFNKNSIGKAITYATATRLHLSMHTTVPPSLRSTPRLNASMTVCWGWQAIRLKARGLALADPTCQCFSCCLPRATECHSNEKGAFRISRHFLGS